MELKLTGKGGKFLNSNFNLSKWNASKLGKVQVPAKIKRAENDTDGSFVIDAIDIDWGGLAFNYLVTDENGNFIPKATKFSDDANEGKEQPIGIVSTGQLLDLIGKSLASLGRRVNLLTTSYIGDFSFLTTIENIIEEIKTGEGGADLLGTLIDKLKDLDGQTVKEYVDGKFNTVNDKLNIGNQTVTQYVTNYVNSQLRINGVEKYVTRDEFEAFAASLLSDELSYIGDELSYIHGAVNQQINTVSEKVTNLENKVNNLHKVAKTGNYNDLNNKPTIYSPNQLKNYGFVTNNDVQDIIQNVTESNNKVNIEYDENTTTLYFNTDGNYAPITPIYTFTAIGHHCKCTPSTQTFKKGGSVSVIVTPDAGFKITKFTSTTHPGVEYDYGYGLSSSKITTSNLPGEDITEEYFAYPTEEYTYIGYI